MKPVIIIAIAFVLLIPFSYTLSFAENNKVDIKLVVVTSKNECYWDVVQSITAISSAYLYQWNIEPGLSDWACIVEDDLTFTLQTAKVTHDLTILILDNQLSNEWLYSNSVHPRGGHYMGASGYNVVVTPSPELGTEDEWSVYVLVQELSHFAVDWYGYPCDISNEDSCVHRHQAEFDNCIAYGDPTVCLGNNLLTQVEAPKSGKRYDVMSALFTERYVSPTPPVYPEPTKPDVKDSDGDSYPDNVDKCPYQRENFNSYQDSDGCPDNPYSEQIQSESITTQPQVEQKKSELQLKIEDIYLNHEYYPAWLGKILYWYGMDKISSDELENALGYLNDKHIICMGLCAR